MGVIKLFCGSTMEEKKIYLFALRISQGFHIMFPCFISLFSFSFDFFGF
jgi:hypothetical protein